MKKFSFGVLALATALAATPAAMADSTFNFTLSGPSIANGTAGTGIPGGPSISGNGSLTGSLVSGSTFDITNGSASFSVGGVFSSVTGSLIQDTPANIASYGSLITFDNLVSTGPAPNIDDSGIAFLLSNGDLLALFYDDYDDAFNGNVLWDLYVPSSPGVYSGNHWLIDNFPIGGDPADLSVSETPEPSSLLLLGTGLLCMAGFLFWKAKPSMIQAA